jgi:ABC-type polysaccharide/polyol phosphate export permease
LLGAPFPNGTGLTVSIVVAFALLVTGLFYFRRMERTFADTI